MSVGICFWTIPRTKYCFELGSAQMSLSIQLLLKHPPKIQYSFKQNLEGKGNPKHNSTAFTSLASDIIKNWNTAGRLNYERGELFFRSWRSKSPPPSYSLKTEVENKSSHLLLCSCHLKENQRRFNVKQSPQWIEGSSSQPTSAILQSRFK